MDCVRETSHSLTDSIYSGGKTYKPPQRGLTKEQCEGLCISDLGCELWNITPDGTCTLMYNILPPEDQTTISMQGASAGIVKCVEKRNFLEGVAWLFFFILILIATWYIMGRCRK